VLFLLSVTLLGDELGIPASLVVLGAGHTLIYYFVKDIHLKEKTVDMKEADGQKPVSQTNLIKGER
jgi:YQGE family putative transporter